MFEDPNSVISSSTMVFALTVSSNVKLIVPESISREKYRSSGDVVSFIKLDAGSALWLVTVITSTSKLSINASALIETYVSASCVARLSLSLIRFKSSVDILTVI